MKLLTQSLGSRLLRPMLFAVLLIIVLQTLTLLLITHSSIETLVSSAESTLDQGSSQMAKQLTDTEQTVSESIKTLSTRTTSALTNTLQQHLTQEQAQAASLLIEANQQTARALAELMAIAAPRAIWDKDSPTLTKLVRSLHRNPDVVFARYYDADGKPLTRHLDKRLPKVKELIARGEGRRTMDKVIDAARKDPEIYLVEVDINPLGAVIGRFIMAYSNLPAIEAGNGIQQRFDQVIQSSGMAVNAEIATQARSTHETLQQAVESTLQINRQINEQAAASMLSNSDLLMERMTQAMIGLGLLMTLLLALIMSLRITGKLAELTHALRELASGDGDLTRRIELGSRDEIGEMSDSINDFIAKTQTLVQQASTVADTTATRIEDINRSCSSATDAVTRQNAQLEHTAGAITEIWQTTDQVATRIQQNLSNVDSIRQAGAGAGRISGSVRSTIRDLGTEVSGAAEVVNNVARQSEEINAILDVIKEVAEQTNLLALNAAIEAARAGDSGRGFAVVADEVRDLASKTQASTENIQHQIDELQRGVNSAVTVIKRACEQADSSIETINESDQQIQHIADAVQNLYDFTHDIAAMAEQQSQASQQINSNVAQISSEAQATSGAVKENAATADDLAGLARTLKSTLGQFKV